MNPILKSNNYIPDVEARTMPDGKVYLYGSRDNPGDTEFCSTQYQTFSSQDLIHWQDEGTIFNSTDEIYGVNNGLTLGAPDCIYYEGKYYLYYCMYGNRMGVAVSDTPVGPFRNLGNITPADRQSIDPAIFVDDDGTCYYFWGQFHLQGGKLDKDMKTVIPETINSNILTEHEQGFHEGASIRKINGTYYITYTDISRGRASCLAYATSKSPLGPYKKRGIIIDNTGSDSEDWNNHGSIEMFQNNLYVFYHRSSQNSIYNRRVCIEPLSMDSDGNISEVHMTSNGVEDHFPANSPINVRHLSKMRLKLPFNSLIHPMSLMPRDNEEVLSYTKNQDWIQFNRVDLGKKCQKVEIDAASPKPMTVEFWIENNHKIGQITVNPTGSTWNIYKKFAGQIESTSGIHTIWIRFVSKDNAVGRLGDLKDFCFKEE
ncbi:family 43 glycosylhydrolase [Companilactobacillus sp. HBUAS56275]|uniref:Family 43 glycosylhydrolase n=1 Tax=Candidatus Companilactobacillus pullicola TaxID=2838523 RepID=A0A9D1ZMT8_9LACO|nr:family 43 glycosylhydrolase [Candidatus Companilactobacillus pullicola]